MASNEARNLPTMKQLIARKHRELARARKLLDKAQRKRSRLEGPYEAAVRETVRVKRWADELEGDIARIERHLRDGVPPTSGKHSGF